MVMTSSAITGQPNHEEEQKRLVKLEQERIRESMPTTSAGLYNDTPTPLNETVVESETRHTQEAETSERQESSFESEIAALQAKVALLERQNTFLATELRKKIDKFVGLKMVNGDIPAEAVGQIVSQEIEALNAGLASLEA